MGKFYVVAFYYLLSSYHYTFSKGGSKVFLLQNLMWRIGIDYANKTFANKLARLRRNPLIFERRSTENKWITAKSVELTTGPNILRK